MDDQDNNVPFVQRGMWDIYILSERDCKKSYLYRYLIQERSKEDKPRAFIEQSTIVKGVTGTAASRKWISIAGNVTGVVAIPMHLIQNVVTLEHFPTLASYAIKEVGNMYAPGKYCTKFPNDVVCLEHGAKTSGILTRKEGKFVVAVFGFNLIAAPSDDLLRKDGLKACYLAKHTDNVPKPEEFIYQCGEKMMEVLKEYDTIEKIIDLININLNVFQKKTYRCVLNNPNADIYKDGVLWTRDHPNALTKGYLNEEEYEFQPWLFDIEYYENAKEGASEEKEADRITRELHEQREREKKEKEVEKK